MFGKLKEMLGSGITRLSGKTDLLEGIAAAGILVAAADGEMESEEVAVLIETLQGHDAISKAFTPTQIEQVVQKMINRASPNAAGKIGMVGKLALEKEVKEVKSKSSNEDIELMMAILVDVSASDGEVEPQERVVINKIGNMLGQGNVI